MDGAGREQNKLCHPEYTSGWIIYRLAGHHTVGVGVILNAGILNSIINWLFIYVFLKLLRNNLHVITVVAGFAVRPTSKLAT